MNNFFYTLFLLCTVATSYSQEKLEYKSIGFGIEAPKDWISVKDEEVYKNLNLYDFSKKQLTELLTTNNGSINLSTFTKYDSKKVSGIIPTIKIRTIYSPIKNNTDFLKSVKEANNSAKVPLDNFRFEEQPVLVQIDRHEVVQFSVRFSLKNKGNTYEIISKSYYILRDGYYISLNFIEEVNKEDNSPLFEKLINSIRIAN